MAGESSPRVLLADDHPMTRAGVRAALERAGFSICAEAADAGTAVSLARLERPDICLLDINMPGGGINAARVIATELPETSVVMLTVSRDDDDLLESVRAGAAGYLLKDTDPDRLPHALRGVLAGEAALPRVLVRRIMDELASRGRHRLGLMGRRGIELTEREWEILGAMRTGASTAEMAESLQISPVTVRRHISAILRKLDVSDRQAAIDLLDQDQP